MELYCSLLCENGCVYSKPVPKMLTLIVTGAVILLTCTAGAQNVTMDVVAHNTTTMLTCRGRMSFPAWYLNGSLVPPGPLYQIEHDPITGDLMSILVIDGNNTCGTLDLKCTVETSTIFAIRLTVQGPLPSPENVSLSSQNSSATRLQWNPPYYTVNQESDIIYVDPHITHYTVYIFDASTWTIIRSVNTTEKSFTPGSNMPNDSLCPMYQVSAWSISGEGEISEPVQESTPQAPRSIPAENISVLLAAESDALHIEIELSNVCTSRISEFFLITLMTPTGSVNETRQHRPGQAVANFTISLPPSVHMCSLHVRISAGNSAGMSAPSEPVEVGASSTESFTTAATTTNIMDTESGNRQEQDNNTLTVIIIGVIAGALIAAAVIVGIICCRYKRRLSKAGQTDNDYSESPSLGGPVQLYKPSTAAAELVYANSELTTNTTVARDPENTVPRIQSSDSTTSSSTTPPSTDSEVSNYYLLQPSPPAPEGNPHLVYAQLESVKQTQVLPPANDDPVQYAQIEHQD